MVKHPLRLIAVGAALSLGALTQALAGGCCPSCACAPLGPPSPIYVVNQGPVASGPGPFVAQPLLQAPEPYPGAYPYVGFVYSGYPYGYYRPWIGAPDVAPVDPWGVRRYAGAGVYYRAPVRRTAVHHRYRPRITPVPLSK